MSKSIVLCTVATGFLVLALVMEHVPFTNAISTELATTVTGANSSDPKYCDLVDDCYIVGPVFTECSQVSSNPCPDESCYDFTHYYYPESCSGDDGSSEDACNPGVCRIAYCKVVIECDCQLEAEGWVCVQADPAPEADETTVQSSDDCEHLDMRECPPMV